ncbi:transglutaminase-like domain-containing protein [Saccharospirillum impatiens]|uniref:transglutaminase-like domain-containing protein n=1 Tax=Saccharospirillum impatiens TaxID=169438 RepID=UPI0003F88B0A|nr:transglutaminase family protein [Saccharospirillum impatiens]
MNTALTLSNQYEALFRDTTLGFYLDDKADAIFRLGSVTKLDTDAPLVNPSPYRLFAVLQGRLGHATSWHGPGNHFMAAQSDSQGPLTALGDTVLVWHLDLASDAWQAPGAMSLRRAMTLAMLASDAACKSVAPVPDAQLPDKTTLCDYQHPAIQKCARQLKGNTQADTARNIFYFVQAIPYRFGTWQETASTTLAKGVGMCTTKANLQVALCRASNIEAGYIEAPLELSVLGIIMPPSWRLLMRSSFKHYYAAMKINGRWHSADATFNDDVCDAFVEANPEFAQLVPVTFAEGFPYSPSALMNQTDPFLSDEEVLPHLEEEMSKKSRFSMAHFEALNTALDRIQSVYMPLVNQAQQQFQPVETARREELVA